ncbi:hypothetical protein [Mycoplasmopsis cynos]|uniref:hypothetical protein n=1 Tax=Mycoplasmopsis cynos TaxID=171284 RepID=UPI002205024F|nr:hypothetical protein [Mycoplasmopsis cynos]UWV92605.1 hypothetical protein NWE57_00505 [Mycoplasmopsis cynos]
MINIQAYKHDGFLYRQWTNAKVIFHNKRHIVLSLKGTRVTETLKVERVEFIKMMLYGSYQKNHFIMQLFYLSPVLVNLIILIYHHIQFSKIVLLNLLIMILI